MAPKHSSAASHRTADLWFGDPLEVLTQGTTAPLKCRLEDQSGRGSLWVVKLPSPTRPESLIAEAAATVLLQQFDLRTPEMGLVELPSEADFDDEAEAGCALNRSIRGNPGKLAFCSKFQHDGVDFDSRAGFRHGTDPLEVARLLAFDSFIWNFDRRSRMPNLLWSSARLLLIDHGRGFYNLEAIDESGCSTVDYGDHYPERWREHIALEYLRKQARRRRLPSNAFDLALERISGAPRDDTIERACSWPAALGPLSFQGALRAFLHKRLNSLDSLKEALNAAIQS